MITGAGTIIYSKDAEADRAVFRDVFGLPSVDAGGGWLIFGLPPSDLSFHPAETGRAHEFYLMCEDIEAFVSKVSGQGITCGTIEDQGWGLLSSVTLPGGGTIGVYEPKHKRPESP